MTDLTDNEPAEESRPPKGIDGWLLAFIAFCWLASLVYAVFLATSLRARIEFGGLLPVWVQAESWTITTLHIVMPAAVGWRLMRRKERGSVRFAVLALGGLWIGVPLADLVLGLAMGLELDPQFLGRYVPGLCRDLVLGLGSILYLLSSKRVANTYLVGGDVEHVFE